MNPKQRKIIRKLIEEGIAKTEATIADYKELTKPIEPENAIGHLSRMDAINNKSVTEAALRTAESKLNALRHKLTTIDDSDFGICARCKQEIPIQRILLMPHAMHCVNCAK